MSATSGRNWVEKVEEAVLSQLPAQLFQDSRTRALAYAGSLGFEPLAIFPRDMWRTICTHFGLYRFEFSNKLETIACLPLPRLVKLFSRWDFLLKSSLVIGTTIGLCLFSIIVNPGVSYFGFFAGMMISLSMGAMGTMLLTSLLLISSIQHASLFHSHNFLLKKLWPDMSNEHLVGPTITIPIGFETNESFEKCKIRVITQGRTNNYWIAALPEAIKLSKKTVGQETYKVCPVLWVEYDNCAIILAQCGEFPREAEAVEFAKMLAQGRFGNKN